MDFSEIIGFLIILFVFFVPLLRKLLVDKKRTEQKSEEIEEEFIEEEEEPAPPPPTRVVKRPPITSRLVKKDFTFQSSVEERELVSQIQEHELRTKVAPKIGKRVVSAAFILDEKKRGRKSSHLEFVVKNRPSSQAMVILSEIYRRPE